MLESHVTRDQKQEQFEEDNRLLLHHFVDCLATAPSKGGVHLPDGVRVETSPHCQKSEAALEPSALIATNAAGWGDMIRKTISCALAGLLTVVSAVAFLSGLLGYWEPSSGVVVLSLIFGFTIGVMWLGSEVVGDFPERTMTPYMGPMASATKVHVESDHCDTKSAARKPTQEGGSHRLATTPG